MKSGKQGFLQHTPLCLSGRQCWFDTEKTRSTNMSLKLEFNVVSNKSLTCCTVGKPLNEDGCQSVSARTWEAQGVVVWRTARWAYLQGEAGGSLDFAVPFRAFSAGAPAANTHDCCSGAVFCNLLWCCARLEPGRAGVPDQWTDWKGTTCHWQEWMFGKFTLLTR